MNKRKLHIVKNTLRTSEPVYHDGVTITEFADFHWCGRIHRYLKESAVPARMASLEDKRQQKKFMDEWKPLPTCPRCLSAKNKRRVYEV